MTRDDGTRIAEGAAVEKVTDEAGVKAKETLDQRHKHKKNNVSQNSSNDSHDVRVALSMTSDSQSKS